MSLVVFPRMVLIDPDGQPRVAATAEFFEPGTDTYIETWTTPAYTVAHPPAVPSVSSGYFPQININPAVNQTYKLVLKDASGAVIHTDDHLSVLGLDAAGIGGLLYPITDAETTALVTPVNYGYPPLVVNRYGTNTTPGTTSMRAAWQAAINVAKVCGGEITWDATMGPHLIDGPLDCTVPVGLTNKSYGFRGTGQATAITTNAPYRPDVVFSHTGVCFDCTGTLGIFFSNMTCTTPTSSYPTILFLAARNSDGRSMQVRWDKVMVFGHFSIAPYYLYGSEESVLNGCQTFNYANEANSKCFILTQNNIRSVTSTFTTIGTGAQSSLCYNFFGCSSLNSSNHATADVWELEATNFGNIIGGWAACANGTGGGRSLIYVNTTNAMASGWLVSGLLGEASVPSVPANGVLFGTEGTGSGSDWTFVNCAFPHTSRIIGGGNAAASLLNLVMINLGCQGVGTGGVNFAGTLAAFDQSVAGAITAGTLLLPNFHRQGMSWERSGEIRLRLGDTSAGTDAKYLAIRQTGGQFVIALENDSRVLVTNAVVLSRSTTTPTLWDFTSSTAMNFPRVGFNGTANIAKPTVTGSRGGNAALASLLTHLAAYGLITDSSS